MSFDPVTHCRFDPMCVRLLWPLAFVGLTMAAVSASLVLRSRPVLQAHTLHLVIGLAIVVCGALTFSYHLRVTEPFVRDFVSKHSGASDVRSMIDSDYRSDALAVALGLGSVWVSYGIVKIGSQRHAAA